MAEAKLGLASIPCQVMTIENLTTFHNKGEAPE
jgi:hypothetical protein